MSELAFPSSRTVRKQTDTDYADCLLREGNAPLAREKDSDAENSTAYGIKLERIAAGSLDGEAISTVAALVRDGYRHAVGARPYRRVRRGQRWLTLRCWFSAAWVLVAARHGRRCRHHEERCYRAGMNARTARVIGHAGRRLD